MKRLLFILMLLSGTIANANVSKPLPWDLSPKKTFKVFSPITEVDVFHDGGIPPYGYISVTVKRPFAYTTCEYTTIQVWVKTRFVYGFPHPTTYYFWNWMSFSVTIPANEDTGYATYVLQEGEDVDVTNYKSPGYLDPCY